ncbi:MAG: hypothetical protein A3H73_02405 [Candidatus Taylorbacteria bacterium RIFCSPLOWO2_02_FULL_50_120]|nr:MAG: hypothetical protein A2759_01975 [Candidatus Taylorbacteria bacterium RIFCSPHIGHO2_01_FULL_49_60]OHA35195.1 MAG: hypothetical protein A3B27_02555 [Candidatus Taylorbacteria bacterium RIFCSPLOWO2_01_FULL_50_130]OHA36047.1 MAG: hypothetical protein A2W65_01640 [Candidatus Taylorbacteria bacterium RIFCSPLOWO2_02_50_13]OHA41308.1 MAG: hypothetical protein A3H73_02405 [Candidatus Taylorbacteria bacterium RIFCSPLOWO2_02_FULL_50_120]OHA47589.1 MAG: hypothetical protein A3G61_04315 [Candidatus 
MHMLKLDVVDMRTRIKKALCVLKAEKADALLVWNSEGSGQPATAWLSGFTGSWSILLIAAKKQILRSSTTRGAFFVKGGRENFLITDGRYAEQSKREAKEYEILITSEAHPTCAILRRLVCRCKVTKVLFDGTVTPYSVVEDLRRELPEVVFSSQKRALQELRIVKGKEELGILSEAAKIACRSFKKLIPFIQVGITEREIARRLESLCLLEGADNLAFPIIVASGKNGALSHAKATDKKIKRGELLTIDFGVRYKGYVSDMTRTVAVGEISPQLFRMYEAVRAAQERGCRKIKAGMTGKELDTVCRNSLVRRGYGKYFTHGTGHGIGMEVHELPVAAPGNFGRGVLPAGSVITCEPGVYIKGVGGVRIEDTLVLTKKGNANLAARVAKKLLILRC